MGSCYRFESLLYAIQNTHGGGYINLTPAWLHLAGCSSLVDENGRNGPLVAARSHCLDCSRHFLHTNPVTLGRILNDVPDLVNELPFDPAWQFNDIYLARTHTRCALSHYHGVPCPHAASHELRAPMRLQQARVRHDHSAGRFEHS